MLSSQSINNSAAWCGKYEKWKDSFFNLDDRRNEMSKLLSLVLLTAVLSFATIGCQTTGGGYQSGSDGHAGHRH